MKSLASDNYSPVDPEIFDYLKEINTGHAKAYSNDDYTAQARKVVQKALGRDDAAVHFVLTGTAANVLSIKQCLKSTESVLVAETSHIYVNESGAPEVMAGNKLIPLPVVHGKIDTNSAEKIVSQQMDNIPHGPKPGMLSIAQSTEYGTVYTLDELRTISQFCKKNNLLFHMDLCRVYNATIALNVSLKEIIDAAIPDIVSLGGTKNGLMMAEAVVIFNKNYQEGFAILQKQGMQLYSKMRYLSAQFIPFFEKEIWKRNAKASNEMCHYLYEQIKDLPKIEVTTPVQTNHIFLRIPKEAIAPLQELTFFYVWDLVTSEIRLVTSFDTTKEEIDLFVKKLKELVKS